MTKTFEDIMKKKRDLVAEQNRMMTRKTKVNKNHTPVSLPKKERLEPKPAEVPDYVSLSSKRRKKKDHFVWD
jgi:hypothetical protein